MVVAYLLGLQNFLDYLSSRDRHFSKATASDGCCMYSLLELFFLITFMFMFCFSEFDSC